MRRAAEIDHSAAVIACLEQKVCMELSKLRLLRGLNQDHNYGLTLFYTQTEYVNAIITVAENFQ